MSIPSLLTPGIYTDINPNTQRTGLPSNPQRIAIVSLDVVTGDGFGVTVSSLYDTASAARVFGKASNTARMMTALLRVNPSVNVQAIYHQSIAT